MDMAAMPLYRPSISRVSNLSDLNAALRYNASHAAKGMHQSASGSIEEEEEDGSDESGVRVGMRGGNTGMGISSGQVERGTKPSVRGARQKRRAKSGKRTKGSGHAVLHSMAPWAGRT